MTEHSITPLKRCTKCGVEFPATAEHFPIDKEKRSGLRSSCRICERKRSNEYKKRFPEKNRANAARHRARHPNLFPKRINQSRRTIFSEERNEYLRLCTTCKNYLPLDQFGRSHNRPDGLNIICTSCRKRDYAERGVFVARQYRIKHRAEIASYAMIYRQSHAEFLAKEKREWAQNNPDKVCAYSQRRRAKQAQTEGAHTDDDVKRQYKRQKGRCYYCGKKAKQDGKAYHVDHVIPLDRGGSNGPDNIVIACYKCNGSKHNKLPHEWPQGGRLC